MQKESFILPPKRHMYVVQIFTLATRRCSATYIINSLFVDFLKPKAPGDIYSSHLCTSVYQDAQMGRKLSVGA